MLLTIQRILFQASETNGTLTTKQSISHMYLIDLEHIAKSSNYHTAINKRIHFNKNIAGDVSGIIALARLKTYINLTGYDKEENTIHYRKQSFPQHHNRIVNYLM